MRDDEHLLQKSPPHARQLCLRLSVLKATPQERPSHLLLESFDFHLGLARDVEPDTDTTCDGVADSDRGGGAGGSTISSRISSSSSSFSLSLRPARAARRSVALASLFRLLRSRL